MRTISVSRPALSFLSLPLPLLSAAVALTLVCCCLLAGCNSGARPPAEEPTPNTSAPPSPAPAPPPEPKAAPRPGSGAGRPAPTPPQDHHDRSLASPPSEPPSEQELLEQELGNLKKGHLAYNTPERMKTGSTGHVIARIGSAQVSAEQLQAGLSGEPGSRTEIAATPVSARMKMTLKSADFDISPLSSEEQIVAGSIPTTWEWDVVPKHAGKLRLHLAAVVEVNNLSRDFAAIDREITVQVDPLEAARQFAGANWHWILTTLGAGLTAAWAWWKKRRKADNAHPAAG